MSFPSPISILTVTTLYPNAAQPAHGIFVETRLRKLVETEAVTARVLAPVPWLPGYANYRATQGVPRQETRQGLMIDHPRYLAVPSLGMLLNPYTLYHALQAAANRMLAEGQRIDLIDAHYFYPDGVAAAWLAQRLGVPVVITGRGTDLSLLPRYRLPRRLIIDAAENAAGLVTVCAALKDALVGIGTPADKVLVLRNGVDLERFRPLDRSAARQSFGLNRLTMGSVGHLIERKGHHHVIAALAGLPNTDLLIAGSGPWRHRLETLARQSGVADRVRFLGVLDPCRLAELYNALDVLVLASSREGWANVLLEAMACGTPVVASAVWGTPEVVATPEAGILMPSLDAGGVVAAVRALTENLPSREATRAYAERFDWDFTSQGQLTLFRSILAAGQPNNAR